MLNIVVYQMRNSDVCNNIVIISITFVFFWENIYTILIKQINANIFLLKLNIFINLLYVEYNENEKDKCDGTPSSKK